METIVQSRQQLAITEDSSDRSESSNMSQEYQSRGFEDYDFVKRLKRSVDERGIARNEQSLVKNVGANKQYQSGNLQFDEVSVSIGKSKDYGFIADEHIGDALNYQVEKSRESETTTETSQICRTKETTVKEAFLNLSRDARHKYINGSFERSPKELNYLVEREIKEYGLAKGYNLPLERMKEFNLPLDRMRDSHTMVLPRERLGNVGILDNARILDAAANHRNLHVQPRSPQNLETMDYERMRRHHLINRMDFAAQNLVGAHLPHARQSGVTQIQQQQQQQQIKSFTIDAILAHKNNQRERHQRNQQQQQLRKAARQECQEVTAKSGASCTGNSGSGSGGSGGSGGGSGGGGKAKRVRTIFTAEQLERLEGEFARQQYMVGPERLYLAHALRLTEAQVKVWFQNRRIKWRKVNHEQQFQAVNEHRQRCSLPSLEIHEDESNETNPKCFEDYDTHFTMDKIDNRRGKYGPAHSNSLIAKYKNAGDNETDNCRKCRQSNDVSASHERNERRQSNTPSDPAANYYCSMESYRPRKHRGVSSASRIKYLVPSVPEESYRSDNKNCKALRALRNQLYVNNIAIVRKNNYKDDADEEEETKYVDEEHELTGDENAEEETLEDVADENCDNASEYNDKEYDQQEADDEVDEESDAFERPVERMRIQRKTRTEPVPRNRQRTDPVEPSQHHRGHKTSQGKAPTRCCHSAADRDAIDILTEEEDDEHVIRESEPIPSRKSSWRYPTSHRDRETLNQSRNLMDRYADSTQTSLVSAAPTRRPRTTRPEVEATSKSAQLETVRNRKCSRCAGSSDHTPKTTSSRNATCRLQDSRYFIKESNRKKTDFINIFHDNERRSLSVRQITNDRLLGDEAEFFEEPESPTMYHTKSRKSKELRSPIYDPRDDARTLDAEIGAIYKSCRSKNLREPPNGYRERTKHSVRGSNRQDPSSGTLKHENHYWPQ